MESSAETYKYKAPWPIYALGWSNKQEEPWKMAIGSFIEEYSNKLQIVGVDEKKKFRLVAEEDHAYPITKLAWHPKPSATRGDLLATTGDYLRIWEMSSTTQEEDGKMLRQRSILMNSKSSEYCAPITSFDWNELNPAIIGTCSIDTTCTIWDIETQAVKTQLIAHDKEVYDMGFSSSNTDIFASVGADGSVRLFDLRNLEHSTIIYETPDGTPLLRLGWNNQDPNYLATFQMDSSKIVILDIRVPSIPVTELHGHSAPVNSIVWAPHSSGHLISVGDDSQALVWDLVSMKKYTQEPILCYNAGVEINQISWSKTMTDWVAISIGDTVEALRL